MRKMMLLAAMVAIAALMMAAAPAFAQDAEDLPGSFRDVDGAFVKPGACPAFLRDVGTILTREQVQELFGDVGPNASRFCVIFDDEDNNGGNNNNNRDRDRDRDGFFDFDEPFIIQDFEQDAESGDIDQSFDVSQTGDNSNQTVGIQGVANTGNAQNQIGVVDAGNFGDFDGNNDNERFFAVDDFCDFDSDGDGICDRLDRLEDRFEELCQDGEVDEDNDGICDRLDDRIDRLEDRINDGVFFVVEDDDNDRFFGNNDGSDFEFEDVGSTIEVSPTNTVSSDQQVNQAAAAFGK